MNQMSISNQTLFADNTFVSTSDVLLEPTTGKLKSRSDANLNSTFIYSSPMDTVTGIDLSQALLEAGQAPVFCRFLSDQDKLLALKKFHAEPNFWFSVGASEEDYLNLDLLMSLKDADMSINISVDVAHGDTLEMHAIYDLYSNAPWCKNLMSGTVATPFSAKRVYNAGCTHIRVGIGPGSACTTRIVTGCGVPNLSAVYNIYSYFECLQTDFSIDIRPTIIADGGISSSGDIVKYLSAGADAVMVGRLFSLTEESHGWKTSSLRKIFNNLTFNYLFNNYKYKQYRGQASAEFQLDRIGAIRGTPEGVSGPRIFPAYTSLELLGQLKSGIASAISYLGLTNINQLNPNNVKFIRVSQSSQIESSPHLLRKT